MHKLYQCRCTAKKLLRMGRKTARNMYSRNTNNEVGAQWVCWFYSQGFFISCFVLTCLWMEGPQAGPSVCNISLLLWKEFRSIVRCLMTNYGALRVYYKPPQDLTHWVFKILCQSLLLLLEKYCWDSVSECHIHIRIFLSSFPSMISFIIPPLSPMHF
jgi:hypothetical protein